MKGLKCHTSTTRGRGSYVPTGAGSPGPGPESLHSARKEEKERRGGAQTLENTVMSETGLKFKVNVYYASF